MRSCMSLPTDFKTRVMTRVVKDKKNKKLDDVSNYRPAIS